MSWFSVFRSPKNTESVSLPVETFARAISSTHTQVETYVDPVRKSILKRYPTLFAFLVTVGVTATFLGLEQILLRFSVLKAYPELIFLLGIGILAFTGRLYKKLG